MPNDEPKLGKPKFGEGHIVYLTDSESFGYMPFIVKSIAPSIVGNRNVMRYSLEARNGRGELMVSMDHEEEGLRHPLNEETLRMTIPAYIRVRHPDGS